MPRVKRARYYPKMPPMLKGETLEMYTDRLTGADKTNRRPYDHERNRACSLGWHADCSNPSGNLCACPCHRERRPRAYRCTGAAYHDPACGGTCGPLDGGQP